MLATFTVCVYACNLHQAESVRRMKPPMGRHTAWVRRKQHNSKTQVVFTSVCVNSKAIEFTIDNRNHRVLALVSCYGPNTGLLPIP